MCTYNTTITNTNTARESSVGLNDNAATRADAVRHNIDGDDDDILFVISQSCIFLRCCLADHFPRKASIVFAPLQGHDRRAERLACV